MIVLSSAHQVLNVGSWSDYGGIAYPPPEEEGGRRCGGRGGGGPDRRAGHN